MGFFSDFIKGVGNFFSSIFGDSGQEEREAASREAALAEQRNLAKAQRGELEREQAERDGRRKRETEARRAGLRGFASLLGGGSFAGFGSVADTDKLGG